MLKHFAFILLLSSTLFSIVGEQCPELQYYCLRDSCTDAGGTIDEDGACIKHADFDESLHGEKISECNYAYEYCVENDGVVRNMSCCGPIFIFLFALLALYADGTQ